MQMEIVQLVLISQAINWFIVNKNNKNEKNVKVYDPKL